MKVYTKVVYDKDDNIIEQRSYNYNGPVSQARKKPVFKKSVKDTKESLEKKIDSIKSNIGFGRQKKLNQSTIQRLEKQKKNIETGNTADKSEEGITVKPSGFYGDHENILHKFATYNTLFTLSGISEEELRDHSFLTNTVHDVIARSGGIGGDTVIGDTFGGTGRAGDADKIVRDAFKNFTNSYKDSVNILRSGRDIFFEEVNMLSTVGPSEERGMADFVKMTFKLHEPFGISFVEKVRAATRLNNFNDYQDAPLLLTIEFKGFDENGRPMAPYGTVRKIPILITRVDLDVNEGGAIYDVTAVRINDIAFDDRFKFPRCEIKVNANNLVDAGQQISEKLNQTMKKERDDDKVREVLDEYHIEFDPEVVNRSKGFVGSKNVVNTPVRPGFSGGGGRIEITVGESVITNLVSITKLIEDMVRSTKGYEDLATDFWTTYLQRTGQIGSRDKASDESIKKFLQSDQLEKTILQSPFVDWFKIKTSVKTDYGQFDNINKMHRKIVTYRVIPYKIHVLKFIRPGVFMKTNVAKQQALKHYNYLYTGENVDIQNLRINYKTAYYMRNTVKVKEGGGGVFEKLDQLISRIRGKENPLDRDVSQLRSYPSIVKGRSVFQTSSDDEGKEALKQDFYDYLTNPTVDMMRIEMEILGDPAYLCQDQFIPLNAEGEARRKGTNFDGISGSFNADQFTPLIELNYRLPDDINDKTGVMFEKNSTIPEENLFFSGVYQVVRIDSSMSNGQFTQTLTCVRLNNQSGLGTVPDIVKVAAGKTIKALNSKDIIDNLKGKAIDNAKTLAKDTFEGEI